MNAFAHSVYNSESKSHCSSPMKTCCGLECIVLVLLASRHLTNTINRVCMVFCHNIIKKKYGTTTAQLASLFCEEPHARLKLGSVRFHSSVQLTSTRNAGSTQEMTSKI